MLNIGLFYNCNFVITFVNNKDIHLYLFIYLHKKKQLTASDSTLLQNGSILMGLDINDTEIIPLFIENYIFLSCFYILSMFDSIFDNKYYY